MILFTREFSVSNSAGWYSLTFVKMQEENWGDIEKVFQKTHVYLWFIYHNITNSQAVLGIVVTP